MHPNQFDAALLANEAQPIDEIVATWCRLMLANQRDMPHTLRRILHEKKRDDAYARGRSPFDMWETLLDAAQYAEPHAALWGPEAMRGRLLVTLPRPSICMVDVIDLENDANANADLWERRYLRDRSRSRKEGLEYAWLRQLALTRWGLDGLKVA